MMMRWLFDSALAAGVVLLVGAVVMALVRQPARRQRVGEWTLIGCLVVAVAGMLPGLPRVSLGWLPERGGTRGNAKCEMRNSAWDAGTLPQGESGRVADSAKGSEPTKQTAAGVDLMEWVKGHWGVMVLGAYGVAAGVAVLRMGMGRMRLRKLVRGAREADGELAAMWVEMVGVRGEDARAGGESNCMLPPRTARWKHGTRPPEGGTPSAHTRPPEGGTPSARLMVSGAVRRPICFGVWRPVVVVPAALVGAGRWEELRIVLLHELVHIRRRDGVTWLIASLAQVVFFYQPLYWHLRKQLRLAQEYVADAWAAEQASSPVAYAENLLRLLKEDIRPVPTAAMAAVNGPSEFYRRMQRLLASGETTEKQCGAGWTLAAGVVVLAVALGVSSLTVEAAKVRAVSPEQKGVAFLLSKQEHGGGWMSEMGPAPTALVVKALLGSGMSLQDGAVARGVAFLETFKQSDGGYYGDSEPTYNTAIVLTTLAMLPGREETLEQGRAFLAARQKAASGVRGGWYAASGASSVTRSSPKWLDPGERSAEAVLESYGSMTYASLKSLVYAGLTKDDPRVKRSGAWLKENWTLEKNPGLGSAEGLYYYYHLLARTMRAGGENVIVDRGGVGHDWRRELRARLTATQRADGSWVNEGSGRWLEDRAELVTAYGVLAMQEAAGDGLGDKVTR